ncbi:hypothetical protein SLA2020_232070 [Shorea laevis]
MVASMEAARNAIGVVGNIIALFLFLSPVPTFIQICKKGAVEQYSAAPYLATLTNCMIWILYGIPWVHPNSTLVWTINGTGTLIELVFITLFLIYSEKKKRVKVVVVVVLEIIFMVALTVPVLTVLKTTEHRSMVVGTICILFNIMMYASPLSVMKMVIRTKSVEYMPFYLSLASFANGVTWTIYAVLPFDPFICIPNGLGTLSGLGQLILYATYYKSTKRQIEARQAAQKEAELVGNGHPKNHNISV